MFSAVLVICRQSEPLSSWTLPLPSLKHRCTQKLAFTKSTWTGGYWRDNYTSILEIPILTFIISRRVFDKWKHSTRLKRSSTLQLDSEIRKELNLDHSFLEFLQEPLIPKNPPKNTCFELELLRPCSKNEDPVTLRQKGLETIAILSQDNFAIAYTDGSSDRSLSNGGAGIILLLPDEGLVIFSDSKSAIEAIRNGETNLSCDIITLLEQLHNKRKSCILQWIPAHVNIEGHEDSPRQDKIICSMQTLPRSSTDANHILECPTVATKLLKMGMVPLRDSLRELLYNPDAPRIAEAVIKTFDGI
ncbi:RNase H domain-containing protein [Trichonephila clavipes]|uniref:RNase H domain-containing protein n=1 Tax=Trichonephila clavipes TaxID=2585209 RepID=A0A8X6RGI8_TRICX|nr:RNase H domain-containing protein [Trichonephila clavipes]